MSAASPGPSRARWRRIVGRDAGGLLVIRGSGGAMNLPKMLETIRAFRAGAPLGDVAVLKLDALAAPPRGITERLERVRGYAPDQDLAALRALPPGSLGREYARFLDANGITPLVVSPAIKERFRENPFVLRYTATHDLHHCLLGCA